MPKSNEKVGFPAMKTSSNQRKANKCMRLCFLQIRFDLIGVALLNYMHQDAHALVIVTWAECIYLLAFFLMTHSRGWVWFLPCDFFGFCWPPRFSMGSP